MNKALAVYIHLTETMQQLVMLAVMKGRILKG
jgi:hypothetical protein